jgi:hypothetical protein
MPRQRTDVLAGNMTRSIARVAVLTGLLSGAVVAFGAGDNTRSQLPAGLKVGAAFPDVLARTVDRQSIGEVVPSGSASCVVFFHPT